MDDLSASMIETRIVYGFKGAGKTTYIRDCVMNDPFYKHGTTLILCFEKGKEAFDPESLAAKHAFAVCYDKHTEIEEFCFDPIRTYHPDRIYVEMSTKYPDLRERLPSIMHVTSAVTWIDWSTIDFYLTYHRQAISEMVSRSLQVTFRGCPSKDLLAPYAPVFKGMNRKASYLRQDPMGYHEKAFDLFVPYSLDDDHITITENNYLIFWLDALDHPEHYVGKNLSFSDPVEIRSDPETGIRSVGRVVMTCCMADLQFMSVEFTAAAPEAVQNGWVTMEAQGRLEQNHHGQMVLRLDPRHMSPAAAPDSGILIAGSTSMS